MTTAFLPLSPSLPSTPAASERSLVIRFFDALMEARMRAALREIARHRHLVPEDVVKAAGYQPTRADDAAYPFTR